MRIGQLARWYVQDQASGEGDGAGGGDAAGAAASGAEGKGGAGQDPSLLSQGGDAAAQAAAQAAAAAAGDKSKLKDDPHAWLPERFRVKAEDGQLKVEDSAKKVAEAYGQLEKRMKDTGLPPEDATKYEFKPPAGMEKLELDAALTDQAKKGLHALGLTQKQYQGVMEMYVGSLNNIVERGVEMGAQKASAELAKTWGQPDTPQFKANLALAHKAYMAFADDADKAAMDQIGNHPAILRVLAKVGRELREDTAIDGGMLGTETVETLMKDPAYFNAQHPRHAEVKGKVMKHFEAQAAAEARRAAA